MRIAVVVPTIPSRAKIYKDFMEAWKPLFDKHEVLFVKVTDGKTPVVNDKANAEFIMGEYADCLTNYNGGIRNLGFAYVAKFHKDINVIITLDDDEVPIGDTIQDHLDALNRRVPVSWISTMVDEYPRGFPYAIRDEAEVVLSHGVWEGVADWDAATQLVKGSHRPVDFYRGPIPKGIYYPMCAMNIAFKPCILPWIFQAPWALGVNRYDDIAAGIVSKREIDKRGWAVVTGYARTTHERASNVFANMINEAPGLPLNETFWAGNEEHEYFKIYRKKLLRWQKFLKTI